MFYFVLSSLVVPRERALRTRLTRARTTQGSQRTRSNDNEGREPFLQSSRVRAITGRYKICPLYRVCISGIRP